jgi:hypothetical protein
LYRRPPPVRKAIDVDPDLAPQSQVPPHSPFGPRRSPARRPGFRPRPERLEDRTLRNVAPVFDTLSATSVNENGIVHDPG